MIAKHVVKLAVRVRLAQGNDPITSGRNGGLIIGVATPLKVEDVAVHDHHLASFEMLV